MSKQAHVFFLQSFLPHSHPKERKTDTRPAWEKVPQPFRSNFSHSTLAALSKFPSDWPELQYVPVAAATVPTDDEDNYMVTSTPSPKSRRRGPAPRATDRSGDGTDRRSRVFTRGKRDERCGDIELHQGRSAADTSRRLYMYECSPHPAFFRTHIVTKCIRLR